MYRRGGKPRPHRAHMDAHVPGLAGGNAGRVYRGVLIRENRPPGEVPGAGFLVSVVDIARADVPVGSAVMTVVSR